MIRHTSFGIFAALILAPVAVAWIAPSRVNHNLTLQPQSRLWVEGTSTVRGFECSAKSLDAVVNAANAQAPGAVLAGEKSVNAVVVTVPARQLDCANGTMNDHMFKALKTSQHENVIFRLESYDLTGTGDDTKVRLMGTLALGGQTKQITVEATAKNGGSGILRVVGTHELKMTDYGLTPPSLMMGTMKVGDRVKVNFDLYLRA